MNWPTLFTRADRAAIKEILRLLRLLVSQNQATGIKVTLGQPTDKPLKE